ncbi:sulfotransferase domain-containing protein [Litorilituus lipolyticus]|uniref:Sulfotransferase domain-containing protein n=1 Tax=Litorilituus lipolyticus TaxID=2491017 RepID=A0A502L2K6_9GAMM|nr:sulfotransferase domain-containing protein [Litorilituus lipolyticus]TPH17069.1 hypothetical protein EPA86_05140 [Litorilituus lipolyticus]
MKKIINYLPAKLKIKLFKLKLYLKAPFLLSLTDKSFKSVTSPVVILSLPRCGSSWVGSIIGSGEQVRYLREPITTSYIQNKASRISVFDHSSCDNWSEYQTYIDRTFAGTPNFTNSTIAFPKQWKNSAIPKTLVIKEVNPLIIDSYLSKSINLIYLLRHPFSVAKSYQALDWQPKDIFSKKFSKESLAIINSFSPNITSHSFHYQMGYLQGWVEALVKYKVWCIKEKNAENNSAVIVLYEEICKEAEIKFKNLFSTLNIPFSKEIVQRINNSISGNKSISVGDFSLVRQVESLSKITINTNEYEDYAELMAAYTKAGTNFCSHIGIDKSKVALSYQIYSPLVEFN